MTDEELAKFYSGMFAPKKDMQPVSDEQKARLKETAKDWVKSWEKSNGKSAKKPSWIP